MTCSRKVREVELKLDQVIVNKQMSNNCKSYEYEIVGCQITDILIQCALGPGRCCRCRQ